MSVRAVEVALGERAYRIAIGAGTLGAAGAEIARATKASHALVVSVPGVWRRHGARLRRSLEGAGLRVSRVLVPDGERSKNVRELAKLWNAFLAAGADRQSAVVALGGGVVGDLSGFAAATFLRGLAFVQVPTTLLAMVDASVGGKVAIDLPQGKNLAGAFHQPRLVWIDTELLRSLPVRQRAAGLSEIVKTAAIRDAGFFERLEGSVERVLHLDPEAVLPAIERACAIKAEFVVRDERETSGERMLLNFGHTLAHALETLLGYRRLLHGEAVAIGQVFAARRSEGLGLAPAGTADRLERLLARAGLPTALPDFPRRAYLDALRVDKKRRGDHLRFVVLREIGRAETVPLTFEEILPRAVRRASRGGRWSE